MTTSVSNPSNHHTFSHIALGTVYLRLMGESSENKAKEVVRERFNRIAPVLNVDFIRNSEDSHRCVIRTEGVYLPPELVQEVLNEIATKHVEYFRREP